MVQRITLAPQGPEFSRFVMGYWRLMDWNMSPLQLASFIEEHLDLGITTVDHADIYGGYQCEAAFGEALKLVPALRDRMEIVTKCGIATTAKPEHALGHYITDSAHIIKSAEQSLVNLATDRIDLLLIHRPDPLMDADEVAEAFLHLHQSGKVRHFGVSNFTPAQFALLQSRLPFTLATNQVEISPVHQPLLLDGTLDQLQQLLPHHGQPLSECRHHGLHAVPDFGSVQGLPDPEVPDPPWGRRRALPLGPFPRSGAGDEEAAAGRASAEQHLLRHLQIGRAHV